MTDGGRSFYTGAGPDIPANPRGNPGIMGSGTILDIAAGTGRAIIFDSEQGVNDTGASGLDCTQNGGSPIVLAQGIFQFCVSAFADQPFHLFINPGNNGSQGIIEVSHLDQAGSQHEVITEFTTGLFPLDTISFQMRNPAGGSTITSASAFVGLEAWRMI
jgi:hypothetical protein